MLRSSLFLLLVCSLCYVTLAQQQQQPVPTPANIVCYQEVVASQGTYAQIDSSLRAWSQKMYQTLGLTGPIEQSVGWARVPDRTGFENNCTGPYPNIADLFVHIQTNGGSNFDSISSALESFIAANRMTSQPNIVCSARSIITFVPGCGKTGAAGLNNGTLVPPTNATGNATTSAPTNATGPSNATVAPTTTPTTSAPTNVTSNSTTAAPTTAAPTTAAPTNATSNATTAAPTTTAPTTSAPTNGTIVSSSSISRNSTEANATLAPTTVPVGGAATDLQGTGTISANGAQSVTVAGVGMSISIIVSMFSIML